MALTRIFLKTFFKAVKRFNQPKIGISKPMLINNKERVIPDTEKVKLFESIFFPGGRLNGKSFDKNFLTEAKSVVNVALGTARGNVEQDSLSDSCYMLSKRFTIGRTTKSN